jgi:hypothetical protein
MPLPVSRRGDASPLNRFTAPRFRTSPAVEMAAFDMLSPVLQAAIKASSHNVGATDLLGRVRTSRSGDIERRLVAEIRRRDRRAAPAIAA